MKWHCSERAATAFAIPVELEEEILKRRIYNHLKSYNMVTERISPMLEQAEKRAILLSFNICEISECNRRQG